MDRSLAYLAQSARSPASATKHAHVVLPGGSYPLCALGALVLLGASCSSRSLAAQAARRRQWGRICLGLGARCCAWPSRWLIALAWTIPAGVAIGTNQRLANWLQPVVQVTASVPATALFPILLLLSSACPAD